MRGVMIAAWACMNADPLPLIRSEAVEYAVVQLHEGFQDPARRIKLQGQSTLGEVDLHTQSTYIQTLSYVLFRFANQITKEGITRIIGKAGLRIEQTKGRCRDHCLFYRPVRIPLGGFQVTRGMHAVAKRTSDQSRELTAVAVGEGNHHA